MESILKLSEESYDRLWSHLLPSNTMLEQVAFLFCKTKIQNDKLVFEKIGHRFLDRSNFSVQRSNYLGLTDETLPSLIKRAHELGSSLVELHSHPGPLPAAFSLTDKIGLKETVSHIRWRLRERSGRARPYLAIVVAPSGFDALVWPHDVNIPEPLFGIDVNGMLMTPTNASLEGWDHE